MLYFVLFLLLFLRLLELNDFLHFLFLGHQFIFDFLFKMKQFASVNILHGNSLIRSKIHDGDISDSPEISSQLNILGADCILPLIAISDEIEDASINGMFKSMFAGNDFKCSGLFEDQSKMLAQELEFSEDAG